MTTSDGALTERLRVDARGVRFLADSSSVFDVHFDGRRVWSIDPSEVPSDPDGWREIDWPVPLERQLDGHAHIALVEHVSGEVLGSVEARFGGSEGRVAIVDAAGHPAALTKWGRLVQPFATTDRAAIEAYLDQVESVLAMLRDECGVPAFLSFGSLLGAVREGRLIQHDVDVDIGYLSAFSNPADVMIEGFRIERALKSHGIAVTRNNGGFMAMGLKQPDGTSRNLDIFTAFLFEGRLYQVNDVDTEADESAVLPLGTISFEGRQMPVPAQPEVFLASAYGPDWRVPNPAFSFERPRRQRRRIRGWFGGMRERRDYWGRFYAASGHRVPTEPSQFALWVAEREAPGRILDFGCGTGRDTRYFAEQGFQVLAMDAVTRRARRNLRALPAGSRPEYLRVNLDSLRETLFAGARLAQDPEERLVYSRFLLHALSEPGRENAWRLMSMALSHGGRGYLEFRTNRDARLPKHFGDHYRRFLRPARVMAEAERSGLKVVHKESSRGWSPLGEEDPHLCRMIVERRAS
ncbi:MAG TPA: methyltransferase domain-containing protein [Nocardioidaceae bacterium]|nr:methyltransferase domain-containing protein [Nocardioidaceae bacterium]